MARGIPNFAHYVYLEGAVVKTAFITRSVSRGSASTIISASLFLFCFFSLFRPSFTRSVSRELGEHNICVNNLAPGFTLSDSVINENPGHLAHSQAPSLARRALKRDEYPEDLLGALVFLASADSDFVTGQTIAVDGGATNN